MATAKKAPAKAAPAAKAPATKALAPAKKRTPNAAFMKALTPSPALAAVVGSAPLPRTEIISKLWVYIKAHNLQDAANKRNINADAKLKELFGKPQVSMFELAGLIGKHVK
jgi:chromatin remodeling complex protein RSC6